MPEIPLVALQKSATARMERKGSSRSDSAGSLMLLSRNQSDEVNRGVLGREAGVQLEVDVNIDTDRAEDQDLPAARLALHRRRTSSFSPDTNSNTDKKGKDAGAYRFLYISVCAVAFVNAMTYAVLGPFLPAYASERFGSTSTEVGMIMAAYPAMNLVTSPLVGFLVTRLGRWKVLFTGLLTLSISTALYGVAPRVAFLYLASGLHGAALSLVHIGSLGLLSAFPERITESMAGIEVWSGVALIIASPLGGLVYPLADVPGVFLMMATFPLALFVVGPRFKHLIRSAKGDECETERTTMTLPLWRVARNRSVLAGAFVTAFSYSVIGFLEVTEAVHLERTLSTSPRTIGLALILPNLLFTLAAMKAEGIVESNGVKKTLLWGLGLIGASLMLYGPTPALAPALVSRRAARGAIGVGMLVFQIGSALASVPAFTAMQGGVAGMGMGPRADDMVASMHSMSIGVGEILGPLLGGFATDHLPLSPAFACDPRALPGLLDHPAAAQYLIVVDPPERTPSLRGKPHQYEGEGKTGLTADRAAPLGGLEVEEEMSQHQQPTLPLLAGPSKRPNETEPVLDSSGGDGGGVGTVGKRLELPEEEIEAGVVQNTKRRLWPFSLYSCFSSKIRNEYVSVREEDEAEAVLDRVGAGDGDVDGDGGVDCAGNGGGLLSSVDSSPRQRHLLQQSSGKKASKNGATKRRTTVREGGVSDGGVQEGDAREGWVDRDGVREGGVEKQLAMLKEVDEDAQVQPTGGGYPDGPSGRADVAIGPAGGEEEPHEGVQGDTSSSSSCDSSFPLATTLLSWLSCFATLAAYRLLPSSARGVGARGGDSVSVGLGASGGAVAEAPRLQR